MRTVPNAVFVKSQQVTLFSKYSRHSNKISTTCFLQSSKCNKKYRKDSICKAGRSEPGNFDREDDEQGFIDVGSQVGDSIYEESSSHPNQEESTEIDKFLNQDSREVGDFWQHVDPSIFGDEISRSIIPPENRTPENLPQNDVTSYAFPPTQSDSNEDLIKQGQPEFEDSQEEEEEEAKNFEDKETYGFEDVNFSFDESCADFEFKEMLSSKDETTVPLASSDMDWREFRAMLIKQNESQPGEEQEQKKYKQNVEYENGNNKNWAHILRAPEQGSVLIASPYMFTQSQQYFRFVVILIIDHSEQGTIGIILNRPTMYKIKDLEEQTLRNFGLEILVPEFSENQLMFGGDCGRDSGDIFVLHSHRDVPEAQEIINGVYAGGIRNAKEMIASGKIQSKDFKFYTKYCGWRPGQLEQELKRKVWVCVSASPGLILQDQLGIDGQTMWHTFLNHMGHQGKQLSLFVKTIQEFERQNEEEEDSPLDDATFQKNLEETMDSIGEQTQQQIKFETDKDSDINEQDKDKDNDNSDKNPKQK